MNKRVYGQYCGFSRALELVGERWALLIVRDLLVGPKRFSDLLRGLPGIPTNILSARLKELEEGGLVRRRAQARPASGVVYELTEEGAQLEDTVVALGQWGARRLGDPRAGEVVTEDSLATALRTTFQPDAAPKRALRFALRAGDVAFHAEVRDGGIRVGRGPIADPHLTIECGPELRAIMAREISPEQALKKKLVRIQGDPRLFERFVRMFKIG